jgi:hypothetical protein
MAVKSNEEDEPEDQFVPVFAVESLRTRPSLTDCRRLLGTLVGGFVLSKRGLVTNPLRPEEKVLVFRIMMRGWEKNYRASRFVRIGVRAAQGTAPMSPSSTPAIKVSKSARAHVATSTRRTISVV